MTNGYCIICDRMVEECCDRIDCPVPKEKSQMTREEAIIKYMNAVYPNMSHNNTIRELARDAIAGIEALGLIKFDHVPFEDCLRDTKQACMDFLMLDPKDTYEQTYKEAVEQLKNCLEKWS